MPLYWTIDSKARQISVVAEGPVSLPEAIELLDAISGANALAYRKLFDGRTGTSSMTPDEVLTLCARIRSYHEGRAVGALAMVATSDQTVDFARLLGVLATADRPIKVFDNPRHARKWLQTQDCSNPS